MGLTITNAGDQVSVGVYGDIGDEYGGISSDQFRTELAQIPTKQPITIHIHSNGGSFFEALAMHSAIRQRKGAVHVVIDGIAASAASLIAMAGKTIEMSKHSWMMIHEARSGRPSGEGTAADFRDTANHLDSANAEIVSIYSDRWKASESDLREAMGITTWYRAEEAVAAGLADYVSESLAIAAKFDNTAFKYKNVPREVIEGKVPLPGLVAASSVVNELFEGAK